MNKKEALLCQTATLLKEYQGIPFAYSNAPSETNNLPLATLKQVGWNCQGVVHRLFRELGHPIPEELLAAEMYFDVSTVRTLQPEEPISLLDIIHVSNTQTVRPCNNHQVIVSRLGQTGNLGDISVFHASKELGTTQEEPYTNLFTSRRYQYHLRIKRHVGIEQVLFKHGAQPQEVVFR